MGARFCVRLALTLVMLSAAASASAQSPRAWYVAPHGTDSSAGTESAPFLTIQRAADVVNPGDTVIVEDGVYTGAGNTCDSSGRSVVCLRRGGTAAAWVTFQARHAGGAKLDGRNNTSAIGFSFKGASYVTLSGFEIYGMGSNTESAHGVMIDLGHDLVLSQLHIHDIGHVCTGTSLGLTGVFVRVPRVTITRSVFHDIGRYMPGENGCTASTTAHFDHAIYASGEYYSATTPGASDLMITNNIFYRIQRGWSVHLYPGTLPRMSILNNTFAFANTPREEGQIIIAASTSDSRIMNNVFYNPRDAAINYFSGTHSNLQVGNNIVYGVPRLMTADVAGATMAATMFADPKMVNVVAEPYDFGLLAASPARNVGLRLPEVTVDYYGTSRSDGQPDLGATEFTGGVIQQAAIPAVSPNGGTISGPTTVAIFSSTPGATIRYTVDGSVPSAASPVYTAPFVVSGTATVKAAAEAAGMTASDVATATFVMATGPVVNPPVPDHISPDEALAITQDFARRMIGRPLTREELVVLVREFGYTGGPISRSALESFLASKAAGR